MMATIKRFEQLKAWQKLEGVDETDLQNHFREGLGQGLLVAGSNPQSCHFRYVQHR